MNRINKLFEGHSTDQKVMNLFITAGYPELESSAEIILGLHENGADMIELGMPFSDPLADGPTIQRSSNQAIANGTTIERIFDIVREVRLKSEVPIILMGYVNPLIQYGVQAFCEKAAEAGVDGLIIPDLVLEEVALIEQDAEKNGLHIIHLVAPNSSDERMKLVDQKSKGFVYCVSVTGVTGARSTEEVQASVARFIDRVNLHVTKNPKLIGFGIKSFEDAQKITEKADGFIVGSALIDVIENHYPNGDWKQHLYQFVHTLKYGSSDDTRNV